MIDWVHERLKTWGEVKRRINGPQRTAKSLMGKLKDGWTVKAAKGALRPAPPEVMLKDALITARAIRMAKDERKLTARHYDALYAMYVMDGSIIFKAAMVGVSESYLYRLRNGAHRRLASFIGQCDLEHKQMEEKQELQYGT